MAIATKPKPKPYAKKRSAGHHRQSKNYSKVYYPYLPVIGIISSGIVANAVWPNTLAAHADPIYNSRLAAISGDHSSSIYYLVLALIILSFIALVMTHWQHFYKVIVKSESYIVKHPAYEVSLVLVITAGIVLIKA